MRIKQYLGTDKEEVENKKFNIWIGISLGNKYFSKENIKKYILWAIENTKEDILIVIADRIYGINLEVLDKYSKKRAFEVAMKKGEEKEKEIKEIISELPTEKQKLINIAKWREATISKYHDYRVEFLFEEFKKNKSFKNFVISIVKENPKVAKKELSEEQLNKLAEYVLYEIPVFLNGVKYKDKVYGLNVYSGVGLIDELILGLQDEKLFPEISKKLKITDKIGILEAYID